ncbi:MAG: DUF2147 domain-containing protein [Rhizomicrobium sp.]|jgi:uncharacterized protein (DUF2147 family)
MKSTPKHAGPRLVFAIVLSILAGSSVRADEMSPVGRWKTISDKTGRETGVVEISQFGDALTGKVVKIIPEAGDPADPVCKKCDGPEKDQRVLGMTILKGFHRDGDEWDGGTILDPRTGSIYSSEIHLDDGGHKLQVRGYIGISLLGRTQTWIRDE